MNTKGLSLVFGGLVKFKKPAQNQKTMNLTGFAPSKICKTLNLTRVKPNPTWPVKPVLNQLNVLKNSESITDFMSCCDRFSDPQNHEPNQYRDLT